MIITSSGCGNPSGERGSIPRLVMPFQSDSGLVQFGRMTHKKNLCSAILVRHR